MKISRQIFLLVFVFALSANTIADDLQTKPTISLAPNATQPSQTIETIEYNLLELVNQQLLTLSKDYAEKGYRSEFEIGNVDPYHLVKKCDLPPTLTINRQPLTQNRITTELKCASPKPWKLFVSSEFNLYDQIVIAANNIRRGQVITLNDIELKEAIINKNHYTLYQNLSDVEGMIANRTIRAESSIQPGQLSPPKLVKRGDNVVILASNSAISVKMNGTALSDGSLGQQISVKNLQSNRVVKARVSKAGLVTITL